MNATGLIDTGAILALLDRKDAWHERCLNTFSTLRLPLATTAAVLTELFHFLVKHPQAQANAWKLLNSGAITVKSIEDADLPTIERFVRKYADCPMDFADATLVLLAERESLTTIFTIDHDDFETYRIKGKTRFRIVPSR